MTVDAKPALVQTTDDTADREFVKGLGLTSSTMLVMGSMIGSGIFLVSAEIAREVDSPALLIAAWRDFAEVALEQRQSIVSLVGENIRYTPGVAARVFRALEGINVRMISQGASLLNLSFVVATDDVKRAVEALHNEFFSELDPAVFDASVIEAAGASK